MDQSWESNARRTHASTQTNQCNIYIKEDTYDDDTYDNGTYDDGTYDDGNGGNLYTMQGSSYSSHPPSYNQVCRPESLWQPYYMEQNKNELETVAELQHLGTFGMKSPYQFGVHEDDPLAREYRKPDPNVLVIA